MFLIHPKSTQITLWSSPFQIKWQKESPVNPWKKRKKSTSLRSHLIFHPTSPRSTPSSPRCGSVRVSQRVEAHWRTTEAVCGVTQVHWFSMTQLGDGRWMGIDGKNGSPRDVFRVATAKSHRVMVSVSDTYRCYMIAIWLDIWWIQ